MPLYLPAGDGIQAVDGGIKRVLGYMVGTFWKEKSRFQTLLVPLGSPLCVDCIVLPYKTECRVRNFHFSVKIKPHFLVKKSRKNAILKPLSFRRLRWEVGSGLMLFVRSSDPLETHQVIVARLVAV
jgi:hypothetical protein